MLRPPHSLIAALVGTTAIITGALVWGGWRLLDQQRAIEEQRARDQLETAAGAIAAGITGTLADAGERLSVWLATPGGPAPAVAGAVVVTIDPAATRVTPEGALPFVPVLRPDRATPAALAEIERLEFGSRQLSAAVEQYRALVSTPDLHLRAEALVRLCRALRNTRQFNAALSCAERLAALGDVRAAALPAGLAGLDAERLARAAMRDRQGEQRAAATMRAGIDAGRWLLARGVAEFYREEAGGHGSTDPWRLARAIDDVWSGSGNRRVQRGQRIVAGDGRGVLVMWRTNETHTALLAAFEERFLSQPVAGLRWHLADPEGRVIAGTPASQARSVVRLVGHADYPWTLHVTAAPGAATIARGPRAVQLTMVAATLCFVWAAAYFIGRAIRREARVARLQSDFVAAVSHEFRSPLTTIRQMAEMLETGRVTAAERRDTYYRMIASESARLQRLVETLLDFGRMEADAGQYRFIEIEAAAIAAAAVRDVEAQAEGKGTRIETDGPVQGVLVDGDEASLRLALSNLIDNAVKYSPAGSVVRVAWHLTSDRAVLSVSDTGPGIPRSEQADVFRKFVRGRAAIDSHINGTGIGLSLVAEIARAHNGEIRLDSDAGRGSVFTLRLPAAKREAAQPAAPPMARTAS